MIQENDQMRTNVLERMANQMDQLSIPCQLVRKGEADNQFDILICQHDNVPGTTGPVTGQYYFPEVDAAENVFYLTCMITLKQGITDEEAARMRPVIDEINLGLQCGSFFIYPEIGVVYKLSFPISETVDEDNVYAMADIAAAHSVAFTVNYAERILGA